MMIGLAFFEIIMKILGALAPVKPNVGKTSGMDRH